MPQRFYEEDEAEEILRLAARRPTTGGMSREKLLSTAAELGITTEAVEEAERTLAVDRQQAAIRKEQEALLAGYDRHARGRFYSDLAGSLAVCIFCTFLNFHLSGHIGWAFWVYVVCGWGLADRFPKTFIRGSRSYESGFEKWQSRRSIGTPSDGARHWLASHPGDTKGAADYLRDTFELGDDEARSVVRSVQI
jgi:hypothetical protein